MGWYKIIPSYSPQLPLYLHWTLTRTLSPAWSCISCSKQLWAILSEERLFMLQMEKRTKQVRVWLHQSGVATNNKNNLFSNRRRKQSGANACNGAWLRRVKHGLTEGGVRAVSRRCQGGVRVCQGVSGKWWCNKQTVRGGAAPPPNDPRSNRGRLEWIGLEDKKKGEAAAVEAAAGGDREGGGGYLRGVESDDPTIKTGGECIRLALKTQI